jgi:hypothetical protein
MHAAAVEKNGHGIILLGPGGSGKTSSCLQLLRSGFKFVSDDQVFLKKTGAKVEMLSFLEKELFLTKKALSFFPYLESVKKATDHKKGHKNKKKISIDKLGFTDFKVKAYVKMVIFPRIDNKKESGMKPISNSELAIKMLRQAPREGKSIYQDPVSLNRQLELYSSLSSTAKGYDLVIGKNQNRIPKLILNRINGK